MRIVLDTNILSAALITKGTPPDQLYQAWLRGAFEISGDKKHMLALGTAQGIPVVTAREALIRLGIS